MHHPFAVLVIAERFHRQREQGWFFFREHGRHLSFRGAVNARIRPVCFPSIQIGRSLFLPSVLGVWSTPGEYFRGGTLLLSNESVDSRRSRKLGPFCSPKPESVSVTGFIAN